MHTTLLGLVLDAARPATPLATTVEQPGGLVRDTWANRASFFVGVRGGLAIAPGASTLAPNVSLERGVAPSRDVAERAPRRGLPGLEPGRLRLRRDG